MTTNEFMECAECKEKPGTPPLCNSCVHNRDAIYTLQEELDKRKVMKSDEEIGKKRNDIYKSYTRIDKRHNVVLNDEIVYSNEDSKDVDLFIAKLKMTDEKGSGYAQGGRLPKKPDFSQMHKVAEGKVRLKTPIGIDPETFYKEQRLRDLASCIDRYIQRGFFGGGYATTISIWSEELRRRIQEFK